MSNNNTVLVGVIIMVIITYVYHDLSRKPQQVQYQISTVNMSQELCLKHADNAINDAGFKRKSTVPLIDRTYGYQGFYKAMVSCIDENKDGNSDIMALMVFGPHFKGVREYYDILKANWDKQ